MSLYDQFLTETNEIETFSAEWLRRLANLSKNIEELADSLGIEDLSDVQLSGLDDDDMLYWDSTSSTWKNKSLATLKYDLELSGGGYEGTLDFGTFVSPVEFSLDMGTY